jgi:hypothetical protein
MELDEHGMPKLDDNGDFINKKSSCSNVEMTGFDLLSERQLDKIVQSREYNQWMKENKDKTTTEEDPLPF